MRKFYAFQIKIFQVHVKKHIVETVWEEPLKLEIASISLEWDFYKWKYLFQAANCMYVQIKWKCLYDVWLMLENICIL